MRTGCFLREQRLSFARTGSLFRMNRELIRRLRRGADLSANKAAPSRRDFAGKRL
jgi:hypothetical protein